MDPRLPQAQWKVDSFFFVAVSLLYRTGFFAVMGSFWLSVAEITCKSFISEFLKFVQEHMNMPRCVWLKLWRCKSGCGIWANYKYLRVLEIFTDLFFEIMIIICNWQRSFVPVGLPSSAQRTNMIFSPERSAVCSQPILKATMNSK